MDRDQFRALQAPLKKKYMENSASALVTLRAEGNLGEGVTCSVATGRSLVESGLHPATGGTGADVCAGDMLLQALVACAGVTLSAVATALGIEVRGGNIAAEGDLDFRGTLGVSKEAPVGFKQIRVRFSLDSSGSAAEQAKLLELTERYCVVYQTLRSGATMSMIGANNVEELADSIGAADLELTEHEVNEISTVAHTEKSRPDREG